MVTGGMVLEPASEVDGRENGLKRQQAGLLVKRAGKYGPHAAARRAGSRKVTSFCPTMAAVISAASKLCCITLPPF